MIVAYFHISMTLGDLMGDPTYILCLSTREVIGFWGRVKKISFNPKGGGGSHLMMWFPSGRDYMSRALFGVLKSNG